MKRKIIIILFLICIILCGFLYFIFKPHHPITYNHKKHKITHVKAKTQKYTLDQFMKIKEGMNCNEVKAILGNNDGKDLGAHFPSQSYEWSNDTQNSIWVDFYNDKILRKYHSFIDTTMNAKVTQDDFNKISVGMSYDEVVKILGPGRLYSENYGKNHGQTYAWINSDGSTLSVVLQNNIVTGKSNKGLR
ncbi:DUF3862 domain-containing protein [Clostridium felsineum]|uniref:DUF3862 domain-containing protein n=1 Tax=Clostridium felsineum TaxID=36839 RepID=UPI0009C688F1|nr:DUF3862 domain-containing protein [Clostridium felsineum]URZ02146.1 hypothetical protein CLAUR_021430 [Clostridium felsineum]